MADKQEGAQEETISRQAREREERKMQGPAIASARDIEDFFRAFNDHDWETAMRYMSDDCVWDASEKRLSGKKNIVDYWTNYHASFRETRWSSAAPTSTNLMMREGYGPVVYT